MAKALTGADLWEEIARRAKSAGRLTAVVSYIGRNPRKLLKWPRCALVIADLSERIVRSGASSALGALRLPNWVEVRSFPGLHAKVYIFDDEIAIVCSANLSENSRDGLEEAGILVTEAAPVRALRRYSEELRRSSTPMPEQLLRALAKLEPKRVGNPVRVTSTRPQNASWLLVTQPAEEISGKRALAAYVRESGYKTSEVEWIYDVVPRIGQLVREGDWIFSWHKDGMAEHLNGPWKAIGRAIKVRGEYHLATVPLRMASLRLDEAGRRRLARVAGVSNYESAKAVYKIKRVEALLTMIGAKRLRHR